MSSRNFRSQGGGLRVHRWPSFDGQTLSSTGGNWDRSRNNGYYDRNYTVYNGYGMRPADNMVNYGCGWAENNNYVKQTCHPSAKRRKYSASAWGETRKQYVPTLGIDIALQLHSNPDAAPPTRSNNDVSTSTSCKRNRSMLEEDEPIFMSRDEIERISPSRKDGIDALRETHLRYSYCAFLQNLGMRLRLPQTTIGTAMVLCHRFFIRRSHACHDRFLIATAALFLASKSEETPCPLYNVLQASSEILHKEDFNLLFCLLPVGWFEQYRERILEAEQIILTTLNFELDVQHPYAPLTSILNKLGLSHTMLVNLALNLVSEGLHVCNIHTYYLASSPEATDTAVLIACSVSKAVCYQNLILENMMWLSSQISSKLHVRFRGLLVKGYLWWLLLFLWSLTLFILLILFF